MDTRPSRSPSWFPSNRQLALEWWLRRFMRYVVGGGGLAYEVGIDHLRNSLALVIFGALATSTDMIKLVRDLVMQARDERAEWERAQREFDDARQQHQPGRPPLPPPDDLL